MNQLCHPQQSTIKFVKRKTKTLVNSPPNQHGTLERAESHCNRDYFPRDNSPVTSRTIYRKKTTTIIDDLWRMEYDDG